jgi:hypothetical protein
MRDYYSNAGARTDLLPGIPTFEAYLASIGFCSSILRVWEFRQRQKELGSLLPGDGQKRLGSGSSNRTEPEAVTIARRELSQLEEQIGTSPTGDDAKRLHAEYKDKLSAAISQAQVESTVLSSNNGPQVRDEKSRVETEAAPQVAWLQKEINFHTRTGLTAVPLSLKEANALVQQMHRHHSPIRVAKLSIGAMLDGRLVGAAIMMRPACRALDDGRTIEVARMVTEDSDSVRDARACSFLYARCARIAREWGFEKIQTYILQTESGTSLRASGWVCEAVNCGGSPQGKRTNRPNGHKITPVTLMKKQRFGKQLGDKPASSVPAGVVEDEAQVA